MLLMSWILPAPLVLFAGAPALLPLATLVRRPVSLPRRTARTFAVTLAGIGLVWAVWAAYWWIEQHW